MEWVGGGIISDKKWEANGNPNQFNWDWKNPNSPIQLKTLINEQNNLKEREKKGGITRLGGGGGGEEVFVPSLHSDVPHIVADVLRTAMSFRVDDILNVTSNAKHSCYDS